jgi:hypothetical protein
MQTLFARYGSAHFSVAQHGRRSPSLAFGGAMACLLLSVGQSATAGLHSGPEYDALMAIYTSTGGQAWNNFVNTWGTGDACTWFGVTCDQDSTTGDNTSHVTGIDLTNNNLNGSLPPLSSLDKLQVFDVGSNHLGGAIPDIAALTALTHFYVYSNHMTGNLPVLAGLSQLQVFDVDENQLSGPIPPLDSLSSLITFNASNNQLSGNIPDLSALATLKYFSVFKNLLSGPFPALNNNLSSLYVGYNSLTGALPAAPTALGSASLCPNALDTTAQPGIDPAWSTASSITPWWATPFATNRCDEIYFNEFD